ncbi:zinc finger BED domain-containing protein 1-like [Nylanderia fulva]|uniref:zinc finger BED domain-containing protein 1-like n=1 Tax=Nylanderia fulva TaxID=613905 RepID=UPI0010FBB465|nr:zinc finger BED domain-containing protein 1-like [Nylanderia fulva]
MDRLLAILERKSSSNDDHYAKITDTILYFMCIHYQSYNIIQCEKFKHLIKELMPHYKIPDEDAIIRKLDEKYDKESKIFKKTLNETLHVTISIDSWSEVASFESFLSVTVHFIASETRKLKSKNIEMIKLSEQHSVNCIVLALENILLNWCIDIDKVAAVVTNDESNIVKAAKKIFHQDKHIICFAHTINLVAENFVKNYESLSNIINKARLVVKFIKNSNDNKLHCCQVDSGISKTKLKNLVLDVNNKWDSMFYMLEGFVELWNDINNVLFREGLTPEMPTEAEVIVLKDFVDLLKPLAFIARECLTENYLIISKVMPLINCAINEYLNMELKTELSKKLKESILTDLQRSFEHIEFTDSIAIATILDPRFKNLHFQNKKAENNAIYKLYEMIRKLSRLSHESNTEQKEIKYNLWTHHEVLALKHEDELSSYLTSKVSSKNDDPLEKWESMKTQYPSLYTIAQKYFSIVSISVPSERLFSKTMIQSRNQLTEPKILNKISFLTSTD